MRIAVIGPFLGRYLCVHKARLRRAAQCPGVGIYGLRVVAESHLHRDQASRSGGRIVNLSPALIPSVLKTLQPDCCVLTGYFARAHRVALRFARRYGAKTLLMSDSHARSSDKGRTWPASIAKRLVLRAQFDGVFAAGSLSRAYYQDLGLPADRIWIGCNAIDNEFYRLAAENSRRVRAQIREELGLPGQYVLYVGRLAQEKNLPLLLSAMREVQNIMPDVGLVAVGDGAQRAALGRYADGLGLRCIQWRGWVPQWQTPLYYGLAECLVLPSRYEPWGLVVNEALAAGIPVIASARCGAAFDLVRGRGTGFVIEHDRPYRLAGCIRCLIERPDIKSQMGRRGTIVVEEMSLDVWADRLVSACKTLLES